MCDEPVVLAGWVDRLDQQAVEISASHPVEDDLVDVSQAGCAELQVPTGIEVRVGQTPVAGQLFLVRQRGVVSDLEVTVSLQVELRPAAAHQGEDAPLDQRL